VSRMSPFGTTRTSRNVRFPRPSQASSVRVPADAGVAVMPETGVTEIPAASNNAPAGFLRACPGRPTCGYLILDHASARAGFTEHAHHQRRHGAGRRGPGERPEGVLAISRPLASGDICEDYRWTPSVLCSTAWQPPKVEPSGFKPASRARRG
jgi:hypothetical protein